MVTRPSHRPRAEINGNLNITTCEGPPLVEHTLSLPQSDEERCARVLRGSGAFPCRDPEPGGGSAGAPFVYHATQSLG